MIGNNSRHDCDYNIRIDDNPYICNKNGRILNIITNDNATINNNDINSVTTHLGVGWDGGSNEIHNTKAGGDNITLGFNINNDAVSNYNNKQNEFFPHYSESYITNNQVSGDNNYNSKFNGDNIKLDILCLNDFIP